MKALVGYSGFVGSNMNRQTHFDAHYNSKNISDAYGSSPDLLVYAGVRAEKFISNTNPEQDYDHIIDAYKNIKKINPKQIVLISTIDVYDHPVAVDEDTIISTEKLHPYGLHRYQLEGMITELGMPSLIVRLPALFGFGLKKNFIYDLLHPIPRLINQKKMAELYSLDADIQQYYTLNENGFYECNVLSDEGKLTLSRMLKQVGFNSSHFTDSRAVYQFYNLNHLWDHVKLALSQHIPYLNLATEPISAAEIYENYTGEKFCNEILKDAPYYEMKTKYDKLFDGQNGYIFSKKKIKKEIADFLHQEGNV